MITNEILTGEITSPRAKRVLYPLAAVYLINFVLIAIRWQLTSYSGFAVGTPQDGGYSVIEHGQSIHLTTSQYWLGRLQILFLILGMLTWFITRAHFFRTGDLRHAEKSNQT
jgi:hypothetical protein